MLGLLFIQRLLAEWRRMLSINVLVVLKGGLVVEMFLQKSSVLWDNIAPKKARGVRHPVALLFIGIGVYRINISLNEDDERNHKQGGKAITDLRQSRRDSMRAWKEHYWQRTVQPEYHINYGKNYEKRKGRIPCGREDEDHCRSVGVAILLPRNGSSEGVPGASRSSRCSSSSAAAPPFTCEQLRPLVYVRGSRLTVILNRKS